MIPSVLLTKPADVAPPVRHDANVCAADLPRLTVQQIANLPAFELLRLQHEAEAGLRKAKAVVAWLDAALGIRYKDRARQARAQAEKDSGTVRFEDNGVTVVADLPKKVDWDQHELAQLVERIKSSGDEPRDYVEVSFRVSERKYTSWPSGIREAFEPARTVREGKETFELIAGEDA
ncbi:MAG: hypothetical protein WCJ41_17920 [Aestuariivirga sp.]|uniref:hypothetical protein n=1 Tax=Aestuariivirga sp. TaxID=2650926 RepID=UPI003016DA4B